MRQLAAIGLVLLVLAGASVAFGLWLGRELLPPASGIPFGPARYHDDKDFATNAIDSAAWAAVDARVRAEAEGAPVHVSSLTVVAFAEPPEPSDSAVETIWSAETLAVLRAVARSEQFAFTIRVRQRLEIVEPLSHSIFGLPDTLRGAGFVLVRPGSPPELITGSLSPEVLRHALHEFRKRTDADQRAA